MDFLSAGGLSVITVLLQGLLSFFSPCVLPLLPLYIGYLSGGTGASSSEDGQKIKRTTVLLNTFFFVIGISFSFFLLGLGLRAVGRFFSGNQLLFSRLGGVIVILFGLYQLGVFGKSSVLMKEKRLPVQFDRMAMSPLTALIMGFVFSFAWTPCVGPTLSSVLIMAASAKDSTAGFVLIGVYTLGFALPFLLAGIFTSSLLNFFGRHRSFIKYTVKISGVLLILMGLLMLTGYMNNITGYLSGLSGSAENPSVSMQEDATEEASEEEENTEEKMPVREDTADTYDADDASDTGDTSDTDDISGIDDADDTYDEDELAENVFPAPDFTLIDQYGKSHTLSDYKGKTVFLNFWATWCPPCREEMPYIQEIYEENLEDKDSDLVILSVAAPDQGGEKSEEGIKSFLNENGYTYPVLMDNDGEVSLTYYITAYPTTFMIDSNGDFFGYVPGSMTKDTMEDIINETRESVSGGTSIK